MSQEWMYHITISKKENLFGDGNVYQSGEKEWWKKKRAQSAACGMPIGMGTWWCWPLWSFWLEQDFFYYY